MNPKQFRAIEDFLSNPNGMNWEDLVEKMKKRPVSKASDDDTSPSLGVFNSLGVIELEQHTMSPRIADEHNTDHVYRLDSDSSSDSEGDPWESSLDDDSEFNASIYSIDIDLEDQFNSTHGGGGGGGGSAEIARSFNGVDEYVHKEPTGTQKMMDIFNKYKKGKYKRHDSCEWEQQVINHRSDRRRRKKFDKKKYDMYIVGPLVSLFVVCGVALLGGSFLSSSPSSISDDDDNDGIGGKDIIMRGDDIIIATIDNGEIPLSMHGYRYNSHTSNGWLSWPEDKTNENFKSFGRNDGVTSAEECATKCDEVDAHAGAWSVRYKGCWCRLVNLESVCKEPCVEEEYVEFSTNPFDEFDYCDKSICNNDVRRQTYCEDTIKFDGDVCDDKIDSIEDALLILIDQATSFDMAADKNHTIITHDEDQIIAPKAITTIKREQPNSKNGGKVHMSVTGQCSEASNGEKSSCKPERISYVRFGLNDYNHLTGKDIAKVTLHLYLINHVRNDDTDEPFEVEVTSLPHSGKWGDSKPSWKKKLHERSSFIVDTVEVDKLNSEEKKKSVDIDVTDAFISQLTKFKNSASLTVKLSTKHDGRLDFAGREWNGGDSVPQLIIEMAKSDVSE